MLVCLISCGIIIVIIYHATCLTLLGTGPVLWMSELVCFISFMMCTIYTTDSVVHTTIHSTHRHNMVNCIWLKSWENHKKKNQRSNSMTGNNGGQGIPTAVTCSIYIGTRSIAS